MNHGLSRNCNPGRSEELRKVSVSNYTIASKVPSPREGEKVIRIGRARRLAINALTTLSRIEALSGLESPLCAAPYLCAGVYLFFLYVFLFV